MSTTDEMQPPNASVPSGPAGSVHKSATSVRWTAAALLGCLILVWLQTPSPEYFLRDPDGGAQLAGAQQMAFFGGRPGLTFDHSSGVARFAISAVAQQVSGHRLAGELALLLLAWSAGYFLFFVVIVRAGAPPAPALLTIGLSVLLMPRFHKYYVVLLPALLLLSLQAWSGTRSRRSLVVLALVIAVATLYRHDYGAFGFCAAAAALLLDDVSNRAKVRRLAVLSAVCFGSIAVAYVWLVGPDQFFRYIADLVLISGSQAGGMSLPHPLLNQRDPLLSATFACIYAAATIWLLVTFRFGSPTRLSGPGPDLLVKAWAVLAALSLVQTAHRADHSHLLQGTPALLATLPLLLAGSRRPGAGIGRSRWCRVGCWLLVAGSVGALAGQPLRRLSPVSSWRAWEAAGHAPAAMASRLTRFSWARLADRVHRCTEPLEPIIVWPFSPQVHYFSERPLGARLPILNPGLFSRAIQQERAVRELAQSPPRLILWDTAQVFDRRVDRRSTNTHRMLYDFVQEHYKAMGPVRAGSRTFTVWAHPGRAGAAEVGACVAEAE